MERNNMAKRRIKKPMSEEMKKQIAEYCQKYAQEDIEIASEMDGSNRIHELEKVLSEILEGLSERMPIAKKVTQYDSETKEDWIIEVPDQYEYSRFFDWVDENLERWHMAVKNSPFFH